MSIQKAARALLLTVPEIAELTKTTNGTYKVRPNALSQFDKPALPGIVVYEIDSPSEEHLGGGAGLAHSRLQFDCIAETEADARQLRELVRLKLQGFRGVVRLKDVTVEITGTTVAGRRIEYDAPTDGTDRGSHLAGIDVIFSHREPVGIG